MTLLEKARQLAKAGAPAYQVSEESIEAAEVYAAWITGEIDNQQVAKVLDLPNASTMPTKVGPALREMGRFGLITITIHKTIQYKESE